MIIANHAVLWIVNSFFFLLDSDKIAGCPIVACTVRQ